MRVLAIATMVAIGLVGSDVAIAADTNEDSWEEFAAAMEKLRDIEQRIRTVPENDIGRVAREAAAEVGEMNVDQGGRLSGFITAGCWVWPGRRTVLSNSGPVSPGPSRSRRKPYGRSWTC